MTAPPTLPLISVIMANFNGAPHLATAVQSVLAQSHQNLELILVDDASTDLSPSVIAELAHTDARIRTIVLDHNGGPGHARNAALEQARGEWVAIVDADDQIHPERFERLLHVARTAGADIVADDLLQFYEDRSPVTFLLPSDWRQTRAISALDWVEGGLRPDIPALGYLKPLIRREGIGQRRYTEAVRIGEDWEFLLRILLSGARMLVVPEPWYLYRRHHRSISYRLSATAIAAMIRMDASVMDDHPGLPSELVSAFSRRRTILLRELSVQRLVEAIKAIDPWAFLRVLVRSPRAGLGLAAVIARRFARARKDDAPTELMFELPPQAPSLGGDIPHADKALWAQLVNAALAGQDVSLDGRAGNYAAGFLPMGFADRTVKP